MNVRVLVPLSVLTVWLSVSVCLPSFGAAQTVLPARHTAEGEALFEAQNYDAALAEFETAHAELEGTADRYLLLWNIGQCYERLFQYDRALEYYHRYLDEGGPGAEDRATVEATMRALEGLLATIEVTSNVENAEVWVDGHQVTTAPGAVHVTSGTHNIEVRLTGYSTEVREVQLAVRQSVHIDITLHVVSDFVGLDSWIFWTSAGVAAASLVAGIVVGVLALQDSSSINALETMARTQEDRDRIAGLALAADVLYGTAGLFATAALVVAFLTDWGGSHSSSPASTSSLRLAPYGTNTSFGLHTWGTF